LWLVAVESREELVEVLAGEGPLEWLGDLPVVRAEGQQPLSERVERGEVVGRQRFALQDREVQLDPIQPRGVYWQVDQPRVLPPLLHSRDRGLAGVRGAVIDDPVDGAG
jgi:hypothetical protein